MIKKGFVVGLATGVAAAGLFAADYLIPKKDDSSKRIFVSAGDVRTVGSNGLESLFVGNSLNNGNVRYAMDWQDELVFGARSTYDNLILFAAEDEGIVPDWYGVGEGFRSFHVKSKTGHVSHHAAYVDDNTGKFHWLATYRDAGDYTFKLTVTDNDGYTDSDTVDIHVNQFVDPSTLPILVKNTGNGKFSTSR